MTNFVTPGNRHLPTLTRRWLALIAVALVSPSIVDKAYAAAPPTPSKVAAMLKAESGVLDARCKRHGHDFLCTVKVQAGCVSAVFGFRHGQLGWYRQSAKPVKCFKGGPAA